MGLNNQSQYLRQRLLQLALVCASLELCVIALACIWQEQRSAVIIIALTGAIFSALTISFCAAALNELSKLESSIRGLAERLTAMQSRQRELTSTVNEELLDPMMSIALSLATVSDGTLGELPKSVVDEIQSAEERSTQLMLLLNDLLERQRLDSGQLVVDKRKLCITEPLAKAIDAVEYMALQKNIEIRNEAESIDVIGDAAKLSKVALNLLSSALLESRPHSRIAVRSRDLGDSVEITIASTDFETTTPHKKIGTAPQTTTSATASDVNEQGTASHPGLAFCKAIIDAHSGRIGIATNKNGDRSFWFRLPKPKESD